MRDALKKIVNLSLQQNDAYCWTKECLAQNKVIFNRRFNFVAIGKAALCMSQALQDSPIGIDDGLIVAPEHYQPKKYQRDSVFIRKYEYLYSSHPVPSKLSLDAGNRLIDFLRQHKNKHWIFLISGGTSSLVESLKEGVSLEQLMQINKVMLETSMDIRSMNHVRNTLSKIKGGGLLNFLDCCSAIQLSLSDVPRDDPSILGSGLLFPQKQTFDNHLLPEKIRSLLPKSFGKDSFGKDSFENDNVDKNSIEKGNFEKFNFGKSDFEKKQIKQFCIGNSEKLSRSIALSVCQVLRLPLHKCEEVNNTVQSVFKQICCDIMSDEAGVFIYHGETHLDLPVRYGTGGRNLHLSLMLAEFLHENNKKVTFMSIGTDGFDGNSGVAGACVDHTTWMRIQQHNLNPKLLLKEFNSYTALNAINDCVTWESGRTNVRDVMILIVHSPSIF